MSFILSYPNKDKSLILLSYDKGMDKRFRYSTGQNVETRFWNKVSQRADVKGTDAEKSAARFINSELERYDKFLEQAISFARLHDIKIDYSYLFNEFEKHFKVKPKQKKGYIKDFFRLIDIFIESAKSGEKTTQKGTLISKDRIWQYEHFKENLREFKPEISIDEIDLGFYNRLTSHLNGKNKALNYVGHQLKIFKAILRHTYKNGLHTNRIFENPDLKTYSEEIENVYLNDAELDVLWNLDNLSPKLALVRDVFLIGCYTGLRISDLSKIDKSQIIKKKNGSVLKVITEKTDAIVFIPLSPRVLQIMERYGGEFPRAYSDQKMNDYIKDICKDEKLEAFKEVTEYKKTIGGKVVKYKQVKWERISNHTARRSFATNMYLAGFDTISIMKITGHTTEKSFMKYICVTQEQMAERMLEHAYFK